MITQMKLFSVKTILPIPDKSRFVMIYSSITSCGIHHNGIVNILIQE